MFFIILLLIILGSLAYVLFDSRDEDFRTLGAGMALMYVPCVFSIIVSYDQGKASGRNEAIKVAIESSEIKTEYFQLEINGNMITISTKLPPQPINNIEKND